MTTYKITRLHQELGQKVIAEGLTLEEAEAHCNDPETCSATCTTPTYGRWFDSYQEEDEEWTKKMAA